MSGAAGGRAGGGRRIEFMAAFSIKSIPYVATRRLTCSPWAREASASNKTPIKTPRRIPFA